MADKNLEKCLLELKVVVIGGDLNTSTGKYKEFLVAINDDDSKEYQTICKVGCE